MFAYIVGNRMIGQRTAAFWGGVYGCGWWVVGCAILLPALLGSCRSARMRAARCGKVAVPLLAGHIVYGGILGVAFSSITRTLSGPGWHHVRHATRDSAPR